VIVIDVGSSSAGRTVTVAAVACPAASRTDMVTVVSAPTFPGTTTSVLPFSVPTTGRAVWSLVRIVYGCVPPEMRNVNGTPEKAVAVDGVTVSGVTPPPFITWLGDPLPPPHAASDSTPARAARVRSGRSHAVSRYPGMMGVLMMMS
jgi:hypothetical protein